MEEVTFNKIPGNKIEKPPVLYHASNNNNIESLEPRNEKIRDSNEGPKIFATPDKKMASIFLVNTDDSWVQSGKYNGSPYIIISDETRFRKLDTGGTIYFLPSDSFENDPKKGLGELEWTSSKTVIPIGKETVISALDTMRENGVQVYFVDSDKFQKIKQDQNNLEEFLNDMEVK